MQRTLSIRRGTPQDASALANFAARTFAETFGAQNRASDMEEHLAATYGAEQQARELGDPTYITLLMEDDVRILAYAQVRQHQPPPCVAGDAPIELYRFYVDRSWHSRGVAQRLMAQVYDAARNLGGLTLWLSVWERNPRAIAFYAKCGFRDAGTADFFVGPDRQTDRILVTNVADHTPGTT